MDARTTKKGLFEGLARILTELLKSPSFKKKADIVLENLDPENAALLVRAIMWEDTELFLSIVGSTPDLINSAIYGLRELVSGLRSFTPDVLAGFLSTGMREIDFDALGELLGSLAAVYLGMGESESAHGETASGAFDFFLSGLRRGVAERVTPKEEKTALVDRIAEGILTRLSKLEERLAKGDPAVKKAAEGLSVVLEKIASQCPGVTESFLKPFGKLIARENGAKTVD